MTRSGRIIFWLGVSLAVLMGLIVSMDPGFVCSIDPDNLPQDVGSYPALCFIFWAYSVPLGIIIAATGVLVQAGTSRKTITAFAAGILSIYVFISMANGPVPHVPKLFGIGGTLILFFYFSIVWKNKYRLRDNVFKLAGYTFLVIAFWFTCGMASLQYQPALGAGESPIDIMTYFVLAMLFFWLGEKKANAVKAES